MKTKQMKNLGTSITNLQDYERGRESMRQEIVRMVEGMEDAWNDLENQMWDMSAVGEVKINDVLKEANNFKKALNDIKEELNEQD